MTTYIQRRGDGYLETVDKANAHKEALRLLKEYRLGDPYGEYYISQRACKAWREAS